MEPNRVDHPGAAPGDRAARRTTAAAACVVFFAARAASADTIDPSAFAYIAARSPSVFTIHRSYYAIHETNHPHLLWDVEGIAGTTTMPLADGEHDATVGGYTGTFAAGGGADTLGFRVGADTSAVGLKVRGTDAVWARETDMVYVAGYSRSEADPPSATKRLALGLLMSYSPLVEGTGDSAYFATGDRAKPISILRWKPYDTTEYGFFAYGKLPIVDEVAVVIDRHGLGRLRSFRSLPPAGRLERWGLLADWNQSEQRAEAGFGVGELRILDPYLVVSSEASGGWEDRKLGVDHADAEVLVTLFRDKDSQPFNYNDMGQPNDVHMKIRAGGSYYPVPGMGTPAGGKVSVDVVSRHFSIGLGLGRNYYEDLIRIPLIDQTMATVRLSVAL